MPMNRSLGFPAAILAAVALASCDSNEEETVVLDTSQKSAVTRHKKGATELNEAKANARDTFKYFWKEISLDFNRIIPAVELASVKAEFIDDPDDPDASSEHMWIGEVFYDGRHISGVLMNQPNWLESVKQGDVVEIPLERVSDWMCVVGGEVYGGYTVQIIRGQMTEDEREKHDEAWGLDFPPPSEVKLPPDPSPFQAVLAEMLKEGIEEDPDLLKHKNDAGMTLLHSCALYGRESSVKVLLEAGADTSLKCDSGWTPVDYANAVGWHEIAKLLTAK